MIQVHTLIYKRNGIGYTLGADGLYYPDIEIEDVSRFCGKYGDMWKKYMMENYHV